MGHRSRFATVPCRLGQDGYTDSALGSKMAASVVVGRVSKFAVSGHTNHTCETLLPWIAIYGVARRPFSLRIYSAASGRWWAGMGPDKPPYTTGQVCDVDTASSGVVDDNTPCGRPDTS